MNIRKPVDYRAMYAALDKLAVADLSQMELYCEIGQLVSDRPEKGAAVAAAEYLSAEHPDVFGFSPRNVRRMREFYRAYESDPKVLAQAMTIGWTQNVVILEAELTLQEQTWYIRAVQQFGWSKLELQRQIIASTHKENTLDFAGEACYTEENPDNEEELDEESETGTAVLHGVRCYKYRGDNEPGRPFGAVQASRTQHRLCRRNGAAAHLRRLWPPS